MCTHVADKEAPEALDKSIAEKKAAEAKSIADKEGLIYSEISVDNLDDFLETDYSSFQWDSTLVTSSDRFDLKLNFILQGVLLYLNIQFLYHNFKFLNINIMHKALYI